MRYRIVDLQCGCYLSEGALFTKKEAEKYLKEYHSIDIEKELLDSMNLKQLCSEFQWNLEKEENK